jgi:LysM repeat protein
MNIDKKALGILAALCLIAIVTLFIARTMAEENEQYLFEYTVQADDTCTKIAVGLSVSVVSIVESNNLKKDCSNIYEGQVLLIPYPTPTPLGSLFATFREVVTDCDREKYTVNTGDTPESISSKYKVPEDVIIFSNGLLGNKVKAGMQLVIPLCYPTPTP